MKQGRVGGKADQPLLLRRSVVGSVVVGWASDLAAVLKWNCRRIIRLISLFLVWPTILFARACFTRLLRQAVGASPLLLSFLPPSWGSLSSTRSTRPTHHPGRCRTQKTRAAMCAVALIGIWTFLNIQRDGTSANARMPKMGTLQWSMEVKHQESTEPICGAWEWDGWRFHRPPIISDTSGMKTPIKQAGLYRKSWPLRCRMWRSWQPHLDSYHQAAAAVWGFAAPTLDLQEHLSNNSKLLRHRCCNLLMSLNPHRFPGRLLFRLCQMMTSGILGFLTIALLMVFLLPLRLPWLILSRMSWGTGFRRLSWRHSRACPWLLLKQWAKRFRDRCRISTSG